MTAASALAHHLTTRPISPGAVGAHDPRYVAYHAALSRWATRWEALTRAVEIPVDSTRVAPEFGDRIIREPKPKAKVKLCRVCEVEPAPPFRIRCLACEAEEAEAQRVHKNAHRTKIRQAACAAGMCRRHSTRPAEIGHTLCTPCAEMDRARKRADTARTALIREGLAQRTMGAA